MLLKLSITLESKITLNIYTYMNNKIIRLDFMR